MKDFLIGADPEFCLCDSQTKKKLMMADCHCSQNEEDFGPDGGGVVTEVRPDPSKDPLEVVLNIWHILSRPILRDLDIAAFSWKADSFYGGQAMGGHIHFGIKNYGLNGSIISKILDQYVGACSVLMESKKQGYDRRVLKGYGHASDCRIQSYGFEYRTPSSWLGSPYSSAAMLCLAKVVVAEIINNPRFRFYRDVCADNINNMETDVIRKKFPQIWKSITNMFLYPVYKSHIDLIAFIVSNNLTWLPYSDMKEAWGVSLIKKLLPLTQKKSSLSQIWQPYQQKE